MSDPFFDDAPAPDGDSVADAQALQYRREVLSNLTTICCARAACAKTAGLRLFVLRHVMKLGPAKSQKALAAQLHLSPGRISQVVKSLGHDLGVPL